VSEEEEEVPVRAAYQRAASRLRAAIDSGELPPGTELPKSEDLAQREGITQETALKALRLLAAEGYITLQPRKRGVVRARPRTRIAVRDRHAYRDEIGYFFDSGAKNWRAVGPPQRGLAVPPPHVADLLGCRRDEDIVFRDRALGPPGGEQAKQLATSWLSPVLTAEIPELRAQHTGPGGIYDRIEEHYDAPLQWSETVWSRPSPAEERKRLSLPASMWVLVITREARIARPAGDVVVAEVNETRMSAEEFAMSYAVTRDASAAWPRHDRG
jgi:GntR family transcriptional regulator